MTDARRTWPTTRALVTGAASGIGQACASLLLERGAACAGLDRTAEGVPAGAVPFVADLRDDAAVEAAVRGAATALGGIDLLVNCAAIGARGGLDDVDLEETRTVLDVNVLGTIRASRAALPHLRAGVAPAIVNVSSLVALRGRPQRIAYAASKGAIVSLTLTLAADLAGEGIRVNCVAPGMTETPWSMANLTAAPSARPDLEATIPMGRMASAAEIAEIILFAGGPEATYLHATVLPADAGAAMLSSFRRPS